MTIAEELIELFTVKKVSSRIAVQIDGFLYELLRKGERLGRKDEVEMIAVARRDLDNEYDI